jgi:predicted PurR-regulated permease PerM
MSPAMFCAVKNPRLFVIGTLLAATALVPILGSIKHFLP